MTQPNPETMRQKFNIPEDIRVNTYFVGDDGNDVINAFSSEESPQNLKQHIQCVSRVKLHLPSSHILETSALLDTGSILNFVSKELITKIGSPRPAGTWSGSIKNCEWNKNNFHSFFRVGFERCPQFSSHYQMPSNRFHWPKQLIIL